MSDGGAVVPEAAVTPGGSAAPAATNGAVEVLNEPAIPARARIDLLLDERSFHAMRTESGDGVICGSGRVDGRPVYVWAQNVKHKGGSLGQAGGETICSTIAAADRAGAPVVGFLHSGGARLQEGVGALGAYASIFRATSRAKVPQISVICGPCAGGAAYSPSLGTLVMMVGDEAQMFLTGPRVIAKVTREVVTGVELGGPRVHRKSGVSHLEADTDLEASQLIRQALSHFPGRRGGPLPYREPVPAPPGDPSASIPKNPRHVYDVREVIAHLLDGGEFLELSKRYAKNMVIGFGRIDGHPVGVIANQPRYLGGVLDAVSSDKGAWFVNMCDKYAIPLVVLSDTPGYRPGVRQEREAVLRRGAELLRAFSVCEMPRVTVTMRQAYGGAYIVMNCRDLGHDLTLAWPGARIGVMGAPQAIEIVKRRDLEAGADPAVLAAAYEEEHLPVAIAAKAGFIDEIVTPAKTRERIASHFEARRFG
jgi:acetyl-CoA carboxylase carboxyltransferase component